VNKAFCSLPWIHLATHPHGGATLCCQSEMEKGLSAAANGDGHDPMTLNERSVEELLNSRTFREVRRAMLKGERHPACSPCWEREDSGVQSKRIIENARFPLSLETAHALTDASGAIQPQLRFVELRLGNTCNIKCVTCNPNSSNTYAREHVEMQSAGGLEFLRDYSWVKPGMSDWTEDPGFWDQLYDASAGLREVYINGGEPMLIRRHMNFLERLVKEGRSQSVHLTYSINMTKMHDPLRDVLSHFAGVHFACSIDAWDTQNFYIRYPTPWKAVLENFQKLLDWGYRPHVLQTVSALNFHGLADFHERWQKAFPGTVVAYNDVFDPPWFSPNVLAPSWRREIIDSFQGRLPANLTTQLRKMYSGDEHHADQWRILKRHLRAYDDVRDTDVRTYFAGFEAFLGARGDGFREGLSSP
jgi:hypothetical protein